MIAGILSQDVAQVWPQAYPAIRDACVTSRGKYTAADILTMLLARDAQLWRVESGSSSAWVVTQIVNYPRRKVCWIRICVGVGRDDWTHHLAQIEAWAKAEGCTAMELVARPGWRKILHDYDFTHAVLEKEL